MPLQAQQADNEHTRLLIAEYERLELILLEDVARRLRKNQSAPDWVTQRLNEITELRKAAAAHIAAMVNKHPRIADDAIETAARTGVAVANADIAAAGGGNAGGTMLLNTAGSALATNSRAIALLHQEATFALNTLNTGILRATEDMYRKVVAQTVPTVISGVETRVKSTQRALDEYAKHGIKGFTDKGGRTWSMTAYAEMAMRTAATRALTQSHQDRLMERGYDLVVISSHPRPAPQCQPYERQVLSLSGMNSGTVEVENALTGRMTSIRVKASLETATGRGLFHPNCRHTSQIWVPGVTDTTPTEPNDEGYENTQKLRYLERQTRDWKRRSATALSPDAKARADAKVKDWQKQIREHVETTGVGRRRDREQITGVYGPGNATRANASKTSVPKNGTAPTTDDTTANKAANTKAWLDAEKKHTADVKARLAAEKNAKAAEKRRAAAAAKRAAAANAKKAAAKPTKPVGLTADLQETRDVVAAARATLPHDRQGWDSFQTLKIDANGNWLPSPELKAHLDSVLNAGRAVREETERRLAANPAIAAMRAERVKLQADFDVLSAAEDKWLEWGKTRKGRRPSKPQPTLQERFAIQSAMKANSKRLAVAESSAIRDTLADLRDFGGHQQRIFSPEPSELKAISRPSRPVAPADADAVTMLRGAERFYPTDWLRLADARGPLGMGYTERGFFARSHPDWISRDVITLNDRKRPGQYVTYTGAHSDQETETMIHELGHRMEDAIPGLTQLEFALARTRATKNGVLESPRPVSQKAGFMDGEEGYADKWKNAYAGKTYSDVSDRRPDLRYHEVFQTGTQDLFGRSTTRFGDEQFEEFMMGVLATL